MLESHVPGELGWYSARGEGHDSVPLLPARVGGETEATLGLLPGLIDIHLPMFHC